MYHTQKKLATIRERLKTYSVGVRDLKLFEFVSHSGSLSLGAGEDVCWVRWEGERTRWGRRRWGSSLDNLLTHRWRLQAANWALALLLGRRFAARGFHLLPSTKDWGLSQFFDSPGNTTAHVTFLTWPLALIQTVPLSKQLTAGLAEGAVANCFALFNTINCIRFFINIE